MPHALITGGTAGIGTAIASALAPDHHLLIGGRDVRRWREEAAQYRSAEPFVADLSDPEETRAAVKDAGLETLDVLIHSAGVASYGSVADTPRAEWERMMAVNLIAVADLTRMMLPALRATNGMVIAINSGSGFRASPNSAAYAASKFALRAFTDALREETRGVLRVVSIHPGRVDTSMQEELQESLGNEYTPEAFLRPESVAAAVRLAVDATEDACIEMVSVRPSGFGS